MPWCLWVTQSVVVSVGDSEAWCLWVTQSEAWCLWVTQRLSVVVTVGDSETLMSVGDSVRDCRGVCG